METINDRFKIIVERWFAGNNLRFAKSMGKFASSFSKIINGTVNPRAATLQEVCKVIPELNPAWLLMGEGEMTRKLETAGCAADKEGRLATAVKVREEEIRGKDELIAVLKQQVEDLREFNRLLLTQHSSIH